MPIEPNTIKNPPEIWRREIPGASMPDPEKLRFIQKLVNAIRNETRTGDVGYYTCKYTQSIINETKLQTDWNNRNRFFQLVKKDPELYEFLRSITETERGNWIAESMHLVDPESNKNYYTRLHVWTLKNGKGELTDEEGNLVSENELVIRSPIAPWGETKQMRKER
jgi:hypothetical protein